MFAFVLNLSSIISIPINLLYNIISTKAFGKHFYKSETKIFMWIRQHKDLFWKLHIQSHRIALNESVKINSI
jgi:hypothetical protein